MIVRTALIPALDAAENRDDRKLARRAGVPAKTPFWVRHRMRVAVFQLGIRSEAAGWRIPMCMKGVGAGKSGRVGSRRDYADCRRAKTFENRLWMY